MIYLSIALIFGVLGAVVGRAKGSNVVVWFLISAVVPVLAAGSMIVQGAHAVRQGEPPSFEPREELRRECPSCGRVLKLHDQLCPCGEELYFPDEAIESPAEAERRGAPV